MLGAHYGQLWSGRNKLLINSRLAMNASLANLQVVISYTSMVEGMRDVEDNPNSRRNICLRSKRGMKTDTTSSLVLQTKWVYIG